MKHEILKKYGLSRKFIARSFNYKNENSFNCSSGREDVLNGIEEILKCLVDNGKMNS